PRAITPLQTARFTRMRLVPQSVEEAHELGRAHRALHGRAGRARDAAARPDPGRDRLTGVAVAVVPLLVVVLVRGVEVSETGRLLLVGVAADGRVAVGGGRAAVAGVLRGRLHEPVVLAGEAGARTEDRGVAAGQVDVSERRIRVRPDLHVV